MQWARFLFLPFVGTFGGKRGSGKMGWHLSWKVVKEPHVFDSFAKNSIIWYLFPVHTNIKMMQILGVRYFLHPLPLPLPPSPYLLTSTSVTNGTWKRLISWIWTIVFFLSHAIMGGFPRQIIYCECSECVEFFYECYIEQETFFVIYKRKRFQLGDMLQWLEPIIIPRSFDGRKIVAVFVPWNYWAQSNLQMNAHA